MSTLPAGPLLSPLAPPFTETDADPEVEVAGEVVSGFEGPLHQIDNFTPIRAPQTRGRVGVTRRCRIQSGGRRRGGGREWTLHPIVRFQDPIDRLSAVGRWNSNVGC